MDKRFTLKLGRRIRALREKKGLSQEGFAGSIGLDRTYISGIERGVRNPTVSILSKIAKGLDISLAKLFDGI